MTEFDLNRLNDKEFEVLANQIVSRLTGRTVERFKPGKDKGVDGRFFVAGQNEAVTQAKHWARSGYSALVAHLTRTEAAKVAALKPARYFLVTSVPLSRVNKQAIKKLFAPHILSESDILGNEDVQDFLRDHPDVVQQHYKLWLASADSLTDEQQSRTDFLRNTRQRVELFRRQQARLIDQEDAPRCGCLHLRAHEEALHGRRKRPFPHRSWRPGQRRGHGPRDSRRRIAVAWLRCQCAVPRFAEPSLRSVVGASRFAVEIDSGSATIWTQLCTTPERLSCNLPDHTAVVRHCTNGHKKVRLRPLAC